MYLCFYIIIILRKKVKKKQQKGLFEEKFQPLFHSIVKNDYLCTRNMNVCSSLEDELIKE